MTDAITLPTTDHRTVDGLFAEVERTEVPTQDTVDQIVKELSIHDAIEREHLYPVVAERISSGEGTAEHSIDEHNQVASTLLDLDRASDATEQRTHLTTLIALVRTHVAEEENDIFPALRSALSAGELDDLGEVLAKSKASAPTRPHPHAPNMGAGTKLAGAASAPLDKLKDKVQGRD